MHVPFLYLTFPITPPLLLSACSDYKLVQTNSLREILAILLGMEDILFKSVG